MSYYEINEDRDYYYETLEDFMYVENELEEEHVEPAAKKRRGKEMPRDIIETFNSEEDLKSFLKINMWGHSFSNKTKLGRKIYYHCNKSNRADGKVCKAGIEVLFHINGRFIVSRDLNEHTLHEISQATTQATALVTNTQASTS